MAGASNTRMPALESVPALRVLDVSRCTKMSESSIRTAVMALTQLQELCVHGISHFLDQTVQHVSFLVEAGSCWWAARDAACAHAKYVRTSVQYTHPSPLHLAPYTIKQTYKLPSAAACACPMQLASSLVQLTRLDMSRVSGITFQGVRGFEALRELDLSRCDQLNAGALTTAVEAFE